MGNSITDGQVECKFCGSLIAEGDVFCMGCGANLEAVPKAAEPEAEGVKTVEVTQEMPVMDAAEVVEAAEEMPVIEETETVEATEEASATEEVPAVEEKAKAAPVMLNEWFAMGGNLDNALGGNNKKALAFEESKPEEVPTWDSLLSEPVSKETKPAAEKPAGASGGKPMDRLMFMDIAQAPRPQKPAEPARSTPVPVETTMSDQGGWRCQSCGMSVPEGTTHCWKCSSFESAMDEVVSRNQSFDIGAFLEEKKNALFNALGRKKKQT